MTRKTSKMVQKALAEEGVSVNFQFLKCCVVWLKCLNTHLIVDLHLLWIVSIDQTMSDWFTDPWFYVLPVLLITINRSLHCKVNNQRWRAVLTKDWQVRPPLVTQGSHADRALFMDTLEAVIIFGYETTEIKLHCSFSFVAFVGHKWCVDWCFLLMFFTVGQWRGRTRVPSVQWLVP